MAVLKKTGFQATDYICQMLSDNGYEFDVSDDGCIFAENSRYWEAWRAIQKAAAMEHHEKMPRYDTTKYKIGYYDSNGKRRYRTVDTKAEALELINDLINFPGQVSVKQVKLFDLGDE